MNATGEERADAPDPSLDRIVTVPNLLSVIRLCLIPVFVWLLFGRDNRAGAALLLAGLGATDWVDGFIARRFHQVSTLGKVLDPTADRLLLGVAVVSALIDGAVPAIVAWPVLVREAVVAAAVVILAVLGARRIDVTWWGKAGTFALMVSLPLFLLGADADFAWDTAARAAAWIAVAIGLPLSYYAAGLYIPLAKQALEDGRRTASG